MHFLKYYYDSIIKYDLINKFKYKNINEIPELKKIILNFNCQNCTIKDFIASLLALELIFKQPAFVNSSQTQTKSIFIKLQKGQPSGCKLVITKKHIYISLEKILIDIIPKFKKKLFFKETKNNKNTFSFKLTKNLINFYEIQDYFNLLNKLSELQITIITNTKTQNELFFLLQSFKLPIKYK